MKNKSKGFAWVLALVIAALVGAAGVGAYVALKKPALSNNYEQSSTNKEEQPNQYQSSQNTGTNTTTEARIEFPWSKYDSSINIRAASTSTKLVGGTVNIGGFGKTTTVIGKSINLGGASKVGSVYAFDSLNFAADGKIDNLYVESSTSLIIGRNAIVGQKFVLSHNELVRQAEAVAGTSVQATNNTSSNTSSTSGTTTSGTSTGTNVGVTVSVGDFAGEWNGTFASSAASGAPCQASGPVSLSTSSSGNVTGYATVRDVKSPGTGKVTSSGNLTGTWNYNGMTVNYSGKLNSTTNSGNGSYQDSLGCYGSFSLSR